MLLSIVIPIFNEEKTVTILLKKVLAVSLPQKVKKEIIVVNDGSDDKTLQLLKALNKKNDFKIISFEANHGKGHAVRAGFNQARGEYIIIQDADLEYNPEDFTRLLTPVLKDRAKVVYGTRLKNYPLILWGENKTPMPSHWLGNKFLTLITNLLYGKSVTDMETCYKLIERKLLLSLRLVSNRFEVEPEITAKILKRKIKIVEVPIKVTPRTHKEGKKISWRDGFIALWTLAKYKFIN